MESKKDKIIELFFNEPTREWHFEEIIKEAKLARSKADRWLKGFIKGGLIKRLKERGKMPYYMALYSSPEYRIQKRAYAQNQLHESGLLSRLLSLDNVDSVILFGSFSRSDWYKGSDIDVFIYGNPKNLKISPYETRLKRDIQLFICKDQAELRKFGAGLIKNVIKGDLVKGGIDFVKIEINA